MAEAFLSFPRSLCARDDLSWSCKAVYTLIVDHDAWSVRDFKKTGKPKIRGLSERKIARYLGMSQPTAHRCLMILVKMGLIEVIKSRKTRARYRVANEMNQSVKQDGTLIQNESPLIQNESLVAKEMNHRLEQQEQILEHASPTPPSCLVAAASDDVSGMNGNGHPVLLPKLRDAKPKSASPKEQIETLKRLRMNA